MSNWQTKSCLKLSLSWWDQPRESGDEHRYPTGPRVSHTGSSASQEGAKSSPRQPGPGHRVTFHKRVEGQGAPAGLVFRLHHHHHVEAVAGEVFALQGDDDDIITTIVTGSMSSSAPSFSEIPSLGQKLC